MGNRTKYDICFGILKAVKEGCSKPTHIMHLTNLNPNALEVYLSLLSRHGLISRKLNSRRGGTRLRDYRKGKEAILRMRKVAELLPLSRSKQQTI
ncbi:hypothetical protein KEJ21_03890 [Candidatus Bathyarchaeota archaeon]|nr:hypothetical protein [Candidatus Bathyarchaeota archaeon]